MKKYKERCVKTDVNVPVRFVFHCVNEAAGFTQMDISNGPHNLVMAQTFRII